MEDLEDTGEYDDERASLGESRVKQHSRATVYFVEAAMINSTRRHRMTCPYKLILIAVAAQLCYTRCTESVRTALDSHEPFY